MFELHNQVRHHNLPVEHWQELREQAEEFRRARQLQEDSRSQRDSGRMRRSWRAAR